MTTESGAVLKQVVIINRRRSEGSGQDKAVPQLISSPSAKVSGKILLSQLDC